MARTFNLKSLLNKYRLDKKENTYKNDSLRTIPINLCSLSNFKFNCYLCIYLIVILVIYLIGLQGPRIVSFYNTNSYTKQPNEIEFRSQILSVYFDTIWIFLIPNLLKPSFKQNFTLHLFCKVYNHTNIKPLSFYPEDITKLQSCNNLLLKYPSENIGIVGTKNETGTKLLFKSAITSRDPFVLSGQINFQPELQQTSSLNDASNITIQILTYDPNFVSAEMWLHLFGSCFSLLAMGIFYWRIKGFIGEELLYEQKWMFILLPLNFFYNNPLSAVSLIWPSYFKVLPMTYLGTVLFTGAITTFWLCFYDRLRQDPKKVSQAPVCILAHFYTCKVLVVGTMWVSALLLYHSQEIQDPVYESIHGPSVFYKVMRKITLVCFIAYTLLLVISIFRAYTELKNLALYEIRLRFLTLISVAPFIMILTFSAFWMLPRRQGNLGTLKLLNENFLYASQRDPLFAYTSFAGLLSHRVCLNLFVLAMAWAYAPTKTASFRNVDFAEYGMKDMLNNSDDEEDLIYSLRFKKGYSSKKQGPVVRGIFPIDMEMNDDDI